MLAQRIGESLRLIFVPDASVIDYASRHNARLAVHLGWDLAALELLQVIGALVRPGGLNVNKFVAYIVLGIAAAGLSLVAFGHIKRADHERVFMAYLIGFLWLAALYGVNNSLQDFADGKQIITFYMVIMMITCIFVTPPIGLICLIAVTYSLAYLLGFSGGRMDLGSLVNFWISGVIVMVAGLIRYNECRVAAAKESVLQNMGSHDGLTQLKNRMALRDDFPNMVGREQYVVMADLDDFKQVNDMHGHEAGDEVLVAYANALSNVFAGSSIYRYGGDEFLLFAPVALGLDVPRITKGLEQSFTKVQLETGQEVPVGASFGYVRGTASNVDDLREQVREADGHLYETKHAKKAGR